MYALCEKHAANHYIKQLHLNNSREDAPLVVDIDRRLDPCYPALFDTPNKWEPMMDYSPVADRVHHTAAGRPRGRHRLQRSHRRCTLSIHAAIP